MFIRTWFCLPLAALALTSALPRADACIMIGPGVTSTLPSDGGQYPGNAAVILQGGSLSLADASVTVDGQPATLTDVSKTRFSDFDLFAVAVEPPPSAGQKVVLSGTFCAAGFGCPTVTLHYEATAADTTPPPGIDLAGYDVDNYEGFASNITICGAPSDFAWWLQLKAQVPAQATDGAVLYAVEGYRDASLAGGPVVRATSILVSPAEPLVAIRGTVALLDGKALPEALCFRVVAYDTAGNTPSVSPELLCKPCHYRVESAPLPDFSPPEPTWTAADIYPGGTCDSSSTMGVDVDGGAPHGVSSSTGVGGAAGAGGDGAGRDVLVQGCSCHMASGDDAAPGFFGALALALGATLRLARRRREHSTKKPAPANANAAERNSPSR